MNIIRLNSIGEPFAKSGQATPPSGGTEASSIEYLDISGLDKDNIRRLLLYGCIAKFVYNGEVIFLTTGHPYIDSIIGIPVFPSAISIDFTAVITFLDTMQNTTIKEVLLQTGSTPITEAELNAIPRITKEQFYTL